jgi:uncharacterized protein (DUF983 family)
MQLASIITFKCPRCRQGNLFRKRNPYSLKGSLDMPDHCAACGQDFKIEPGFYIGALWTSFPIVILIMTLLSILFLGYFKMEMNWFFVALTVILFLLQPIIIRLGRSIWIHVFIGFDEHAEIK